MMLVTWNVRGLNKAYKQKKMQKFIRENRISIIAIVEYRVQEKYSSKIINKIAPKWKWCTNYESGGKGRIWIVWDPNEIAYTIISYKPQYIYWDAILLASR